MIRTRHLLLTSLLIPLALPAHAQVRDTMRTDTAVYRIGAIAVQATRPVTTVGGSGAIEVRLDSLYLPPAPLLEEVLRDLPMLHVRTNSRGESEISARGSESRQVAILVDGVPLTIAWDARTDVSVIPASAPQEIGYIRGLSSMLYGPNVLGGILEVGVGKNFRQPGESSGQVAVGVDHVGGYSTSASITAPITSSAGNWLFRGGLGFRDSPGQPLADGVTEPVPGEDADLRLNTDAQNVDGFLSVRYHDADGAWFALSGSSFEANRGIAAELGVDEARFWRYPHVARTVAVLSGGTGDGVSPFGGRGDVEASIGIDVGRTEIDAYTSRAYDELDGFENGSDRTLTLRLLADQTIGAAGELRGAFTLSEIRHDEELPDDDARYRQRLWSLGAENIWRVIENGSGIRSLRVSAGGAFDVAETPETGGREAQGRLDEWGARVGFSAALGSGNTLLHGGISRRGRFPALRELYSGALNRFLPNPDLRPERLVAMEAGVTRRIGNGELQAVVFHHDLKDAVVRTTLPDRRFFRVNRNRLESAGVELLFTQTIGAVSLGGDLTAQSVDLTDTVEEVTNQPENLPELFGSAFAQFPIIAGLDGRVEAHHTGSQFCIDPGSGEDSELDAGTILNGMLSRVWSIRPQPGNWFSRLETRVTVSNAGDTALYDQCGLPQPGRLVRFQVRLF